MARTEKKVRQLVEEDAEMETALAAVLRAADNGDEVEWGDVRDDLTSGQWGRLIETGVLESGDAGFRPADPGAIEAVVGEVEGDSGSGLSLFDSASDDEDATEGSDDDASWSQLDKAAGLVALSMMAGYYFPPVRDTIGTGLNLIFGPIDAALPFYAVILSAALFTGAYSTILQNHLMNTEKVAEVQEKMQAIQERRKEAKERGDEEALDRIQEEQMDAMGDQLGMFKAQFRPMVWIMLLTIPIFLWMYWKILANGVGGQTVVMPFAGEVEWNGGALGPMPAWIVWYFLCSMGFSQLIRKSLNIQTTPTSS